MRSYFRSPEEYLEALGRTDGAGAAPPSSPHPTYRAAYRLARRARNLEAGVRVMHVHIPLSPEHDNDG